MKPTETHEPYLTAMPEPAPPATDIELLCRALEHANSMSNGLREVGMEARADDMFDDLTNELRRLINERDDA